MPHVAETTTAFFDDVLSGAGFGEPEPTTTATTLPSHNRPATFDAIAFLSSHGVQIRNTTQDSFGTKYTLAECPFDSNHKAPDSYVTVSDKGIIFHCSHDSCAGYKWQDVRRIFQPGYDQPKVKPSPTTFTTMDNTRAIPERIEYQTLTLRALKDIPDPVYFIPGILEKTQCGVVAGQYKTTKTTAGGVALAYAVSTGADYLGRFPVAHTTRVGMFSGEAGPAQLRSIVRRVAAFHGDHDPWDHKDLIFSCEKLPKIGDARYMDALERWIAENNFGLVLIDPGYAALSAIGDGAGNYYKVAELLFQITELSKKTGCVILLFPHMTKAPKYDPPLLSDIQWSGFGEWSGQWLLFGKRREWDDQIGQHWLWLVAGGRSGHASTYGLDIREGLQTDVGGKVFEPTIIEKSDAFGAAVDAQHELRERLAGREIEKAERAIRDAFRAMGAGCHVKAHVLERSGTSGKGKAIRAAWAAMLRRKEITVTEDACKGGNKRPCNGYTWDPPKS